MQHAAFANTEVGYELSRLQTVLYRRFAANERITSLSLRVRALCSIYMAAGVVSNVRPQALSTVPSTVQLERGEAPPVSEVQLFVSTKQAGYLYQLASPPLTRTRPLTTYLYTGTAATLSSSDAYCGTR